MKWYVSLNHSWVVTLNPEGDGLALLVQRGIACENHTQVVTVHTTNTPGEAAVRRVVERDRELLNRQIDGFVAFTHTFGWAVPENACFKESVGLLFQRHLLWYVAVEAQKLEESACAK